MRAFMDPSQRNFGKPPTTSGGVSPAAGPAAGRAAFGQASATAMSLKWSALHDAAGAVLTLAGEAAEIMRVEIRNFPAVIRDAGGWRHNLAEEGIEDVTAIMEPGLAALLAVHARGADAAPAARALWQEFKTARDGLLALIPPAPQAGPKFFA